MKIDRLLQTDGVWKISLSTKHEEDVSRLWIHEYQMRFGTALLKIGRHRRRRHKREASQQRIFSARHGRLDGVHDRERI